MPNTPTSSDKPVAHTQNNHPNTAAGDNALPIIGLVLAFLMPFVGFVLSIVALVFAKKNKGKIGLPVAGVIIGGFFTALLAAMFIFAAVFLAIFAGNAVSTFKDSLNVSDQYVKAVQMNDPATTTTVNPESVASGQGLSMPRILKFAGLAGYQPKVVAHNSQTVNGVETTVIVYQFTKDGQPGYVKVTLQKVGSNWTITNTRYSETPLDATID